MPDSLILESPAHPSVSTAAQPSIAAYIAAEMARVLPSTIFREADQIEIGTRRATVAFGLVWDTVGEIDGLGGEAKDNDGRLKLLTADHLANLSARLYLLLGTVSDEVKAARERAEKIAEAAAALKQPVPTQSLGNSDGLIALRLELQAAEDAVNKGDAPESGPVVDDYHAVNERFIEAPARTPAEMLLKLERLAEMGELGKEPGLATNRIVLNLIRDLRGALGIHGHVQ